MRAVPFGLALAAGALAQGGHSIAALGLFVAALGICFDIMRREFKP